MELSAKEASQVFVVAKVFIRYHEHLAGLPRNLVTQIEIGKI